MAAPKMTMRCEWVNCGKRCGGCPDGPYWYGYWREAGKVRKRYFGRKHPDELDQAEAKEDPRDAILSDRTASLHLALSILGKSNATPLKDCKEAFRKSAL